MTVKTNKEEDVIKLPKDDYSPFPVICGKEPG